MAEEERKGGGDADASLELVEAEKCFGGTVATYRHASSSTGTSMRFAVFLPAAAEEAPVPVLYCLAGLTCTEQNFISKSGAARCASERNIALVCPDTSPRDANIDGEDDHWAFGTGAGFYVDATEPQWEAAYNMYSYVTQELPALVARHLPIDTSSAAIMGHSMGGHGALVVALRNPTAFASVSAFAPICHPTQCPWGVRAFTGYLGPDEASWSAYDATMLMQAGSKDPLPFSILIDQGTSDKFYAAKQLLPEAFAGACKAAGFDRLTLRMQEGYGHSYFFVTSFMKEHITFHADALRAADAKQTTTPV